MSKVLVVGSLNMDLVVETRTFPRLGETLFGTAFATHPGGKGANQAVAAARLGADVTLIGRVGDDAFGRELKAGLSAEGIDTRWVSETASVSTGCRAYRAYRARRGTYDRPVDLDIEQPVLRLFARGRCSRSQSGRSGLDYG
jgi:sugar/nucleoside kinase (ribokinase family)